MSRSTIDISYIQVSGSNTGGGNEIFKDVSGNTLNFKTLVAGANISLTSTNDTITISGGSGGGGSFTANNGLTKSGQNVTLGGTLTGATTITSPATGSRLSFAGFPVQYSTDLSVNYNPRSLVDRGYVTGITNTLQTKSSITIYTGTTAPNQFAAKTNFNLFTGTTAPATYQSKASINTYTGTTAPATFASKSVFNTYTGATQPVITGATTGGTSLGTGNTVFAGKVDRNLTFKSIVAGSGIGIVSTPTQLTITSTGGGSTAAAGLTRQVQYNTGGILAASSTFIFDPSTGLTTNLLNLSSTPSIGTLSDNILIRNTSTGSIQTISTSAIGTANNGITKTGNNYRLGGTLTGATTINALNTSNRLSFGAFPVQYVADYSVNYTNRSLVDRGYVTGVTSTLVPLSTYNTYVSTTAPAQFTTTGNNGITKTGQNFRLGGTLTGATTISGAFGLNFTNNSWTFGTRAAGTVGNNSFTVGTNNVASGSTYGFVFGDGSSVSNGFAFGVSVKALGVNSIAFGQNSRSLGNNSYAEGNATISSGFASHAEGASTTASNNYTHAEGFLTIASGSTSHAEGQQTIASGNQSHAEGFLTIASGLASHAGGQANNLTKEILASGIASFHHSYTDFSQTVGHGATGQWSAILGGRNHNAGGGASIVLGGETNKVNSGARSSILGGSSNTITAITADGSTIIGGQTNLINDSAVSLIASAYNGQINTSSNSVIIGSSATIINNGSNIIALGVNSATLTNVLNNHTIVANLAINTAPTIDNVNDLLVWDATTKKIGRTTRAGLGGGGGGITTANNGLTVSGTNVRLGGTLTGSTTIAGSSFDLLFTNRSLTLGTRTGTTGTNSFSIGTNNSASNIAFVVGTGNRVQATGSNSNNLIVGLDNRYTPSSGNGGNIVVGNDNRFTGTSMNNSIAVGRLNQIIGGSSFAFGESNKINAQYSGALGISNNITGNASIGIGSSNIIASGSIGAGIANNVTGNTSIGIGSYTNVGGFSNIAIGVGNISSRLFTGGQSSINISSTQSGFGNASRIINSTIASIFGGNAHIIDNAQQSTIFGGSVNTIAGSSLNSIIGSNQSVISGGTQFSIISGGRINKITGSVTNSNNSIIGSLQSNIIGLGSLTRSVIIAGNNNQITGTSVQDASIIGGVSNLISASGGFTSSNNSIIGGSSNKIRSSGGGTNSSFILGGQFNSITGSTQYSGIIAGTNSKINTSVIGSVIIGGGSITLSGSSQNNHVVVPNLMLWNTPVTSVAVTDDVLVWNSSDRKVKKVTQATLKGTDANHSNIVYVSKNGNDGTGAVNNISKPYLTIAQAVTAANAIPAKSAQNRVLVYVLPGSYTLISTQLMVSFVDIYFSPSTFILSTSNNNIFQWNANTDANIFGYGEVNYSSAFGQNILRFTDMGTLKVTVEFKSVNIVSTGLVISESSTIASTATITLKIDTILLASTSRYGNLGTGTSNSTEFYISFNEFIHSGPSASIILSCGTAAASLNKIFINGKKMITQSLPSGTGFLQLFGALGISAYVNIDEIITSGYLFDMRNNVSIKFKGKLTHTTPASFFCAIYFTENGGRLYLDSGTVITTPSTNSINAGSAGSNVYVYGDVYSNKAVSANVTLNLGTFNVTAAPLF